MLLMRKKVKKIVYSAAVFAKLYIHMGTSKKLAAAFKTAVF